MFVLRTRGSGPFGTDRMRTGVFVLLGEEEGGVWPAICTLLVGYDFAVAPRYK